jgi:hypothetical protein
MTPRRRAAIVAGAGAAIAIAWFLYAIYIGLLAWDGEYCTDADRATCEEADRLYNVAQIAVALAGLGLATRALRAAVRYARGRGSGRDARSAALPAIGAFVLWILLVGGRIAAAGHPW